MTYAKLKEIFEENGIPDDARLMSNSGWECDETDMDGIYYNSTENVIIFTQEGRDSDSEADDPLYKRIYSIKE